MHLVPKINTNIFIKKLQLVALVLLVVSLCGSMSDPSKEKEEPKPMAEDQSATEKNKEKGDAKHECGSMSDPSKEKEEPEPMAEDQSETEENKETGDAKHEASSENMVSTNDAESTGVSKEHEKKEEEDQMPTTLEGFKFAFNDEGEMRHTVTGERFEFKIREEHSYNQKRYEAIGELLTEYVYELLEKEAGLKKVFVPVDHKENEARSFIFLSEDALTNPDKLMLLIHGSGVVRAGQWARRLIMNDNLNSGTQLPFIKKAKEDGYGVIVFNTNHNSVETDGVQEQIRASETPEDHASYVWENFVTKAAAQHIAIVAHSYGGVVTVDMSLEHQEDFLKKVFAVAFTDSVHSLEYQKVPQDIKKFYQKNAINWVSHDDPLDTPVRQSRHDCPRISAGHPKHEMTSWSSFPSIFKFFADKYSKLSDKKEEL